MTRFTITDSDFLLATAEYFDRLAAESTEDSTIQAMANNARNCKAIADKINARINIQQDHMYGMLFLSPEPDLDI